MGAIGTARVDTSERLTRLRTLMQQQDVKVDAFLVPSEDEHFSEYPSEADKRRGFISGFNGSAGCAIVTLNDAYLFTDGRYFLQAEQQLDTTTWSDVPRDVPTWQEFLQKNLVQGTRIGVDPTLILGLCVIYVVVSYECRPIQTLADAQSLKNSLGKSELVPLSQNPVDIVWGSERPRRPKNPVFALNVKYSGLNHSFAAKLDRVRQELAKKSAVALAVTLLDEVAWLFNLRGTDIDFNPVFFAYAVVKHDSAVLFIDETQLDDAVRTHLDQDVGGLVKKDQPVLLGDKTNLAVVHALGEENVVIVPSPTAALKAIKNSTEIEGFRQCHIRDGAALARYFAWLEEQLNNRAVLNESQGSDKLEEFRAELDLFRGLSFTTISSAGPNAAVIHYSPDPNDCAIISKDQIYLCDSGGQYLDGTTDVTRTWHFGTPSKEEKRAFTRVLQGHIAIDTAIFPTGTTGYVMCVNIRLLCPKNADNTSETRGQEEPYGEMVLTIGLLISLYMEYIDLTALHKYRHGTGHGVGHFLNVHEGPQGIGTRIAYNSTGMKPGMTVSNEPGYYADGKWGIRIESVVIVREVNTPNNFGKNGYLGFERVTMCPIQTSLIDLSILTAEEKKWLNDYHAEVEFKVAPLLEGKDEHALAWLKRQCQPV
ncbi:Creatinase/aminopeptidase [Chiua virens]|nr:Creatinase/aminopeptidase [Chiua virens]